MRRPLDLAAVRRDDLLLDRLGRGEVDLTAAGRDLDDVALLLAGWRAGVVPSGGASETAPDADLDAAARQRSGIAGRRPALIGLVLAGALVSAGGVAAAASVRGQHRAFWSVSAAERAPRPTPAAVQLPAQALGPAPAPAGGGVAGPATLPHARDASAVLPLGGAANRGVPASAVDDRRPRSSRAVRVAGPAHGIRRAHPAAHRGMAAVSGRDRLEPGVGRRDDAPPAAQAAQRSGQRDVAASSATSAVHLTPTTSHRKAHRSHHRGRWGHHRWLKERSAPPPPARLPPERHA